MTGRPDGREPLTVSAAEAGRRLDLFLTARRPDLSRSEIQRLIRSGHVTAPGLDVKASALVQAGLTVHVSVPEPTAAVVAAEDLPLVVIAEDPDFIVVNKPADMVVHPAPGHRGGTLVNALLHHVKGLSGIGGEERPGLVHRLDRGTSGVMVVARNDRAHRELSRQFHDRTVIKEYVALVWGTLAAGEAMTSPIGRDPRDRLRMSTRARRGRSAHTLVVDSEALHGVSLVRIRIGTGRTHQIRVHLSEAGHPVVGDALYGGVRRRLPPELRALATLHRPFLHAARLGFAHPGNGRPVVFEADPPEDLASILATLRRVSSSRATPLAFAGRE